MLTTNKTARTEKVKNQRQGALVSPLFFSMSSVRSVHSFLAFVGGSFLLLTIVTGVLYSVCSSFYKHDQIKFLLQLHQMSILGISKFYVPVLGVYVLGQVSLGGGFEKSIEHTFGSQFSQRSCRIGGFKIWDSVLVCFSLKFGPGDACTRFLSCWGPFCWP